MSRSLLRYFCCAALLLPFPAMAATEVLVPDTTRIGNPSPATDAGFGTSVAGIGDVNGDGIGDLVIGAPGADKVWVISGKDQSVLRIVGDPDGLSKYRFGFSVAGTGDWDGDGIDDFGVGAPGVPGAAPPPCLLPPCKPDPQWGRVAVISGATGKLIKMFSPPEETLQFGYALAPLADINGDGKPDLAVGAPPMTESLGRVYALSGADGSQIWKAQETGAGLSLKQTIASFGASLATLRDINGDGKPDLVVGAPFHDDGTGKLAGAAYVLSGADGTQIRSHATPQASADNRFGISVTNIGDQDGDGKNDYMVGDSKASKAYLFGGADGSFLGAVASRELNDSFGFGAATVSDYDGDGKSDFWISAPDSDRVYLMNGSGTQLLDVADPMAGNKSFGHALATTRDLGGDQGLDLAVGAPGEVAGSGAAYVVTVRENKPPVAKAGADQVIECDRTGAVTLDGSGSFDPDKDPITFAWKQVSGTKVELSESGSKATFASAPPGIYEFELTVTDDKGASSTDNVIVTIRDTTPPRVTVSLTPGKLWPPNHTMVDIAALISARDICDPDPSVKLLSIASNEPANGTGDGNTSPDIAGATFGEDDRAFQLRAERKGNGNGRVYTAIYEAQDASGNQARQNGTVTVAHNVASVSDSSLSFGTLPVGTTSSVKIITISNPGPDFLMITSIVTGGSNGSNFSATTTCSAGVAPGATCSINLTFKPDAAGSRSGSLVISSNADDSPQTVALTGMATLGTPDYAVEAFPNSATIRQGQSAAFRLTVTPSNGFNQAVSFACSGLPAGASCSFLPGTVTPSGGPAITTLTVATTAPSVRSSLVAPGRNWPWSLGGAFAAAILLIPGRRQKRIHRQGRLLVTLIVLIGLSLGVACGGGGTSAGTATSVNSATPLGTAQVTVSAVAGPTGATGQHGTGISITVAP